MTKEIADLSKNKKDYFLIVIKSTIIPTSTERVIIPLFEKNSGKKAGKDFGICVNLEFLRGSHDAIISFFNEEHIHNPILLKAVRKINEKMKKIRI